MARSKKITPTIDQKAMEVVQMPVDKVIPYKNNPRKNKAAISEVAKSLKEFGWQQPIVVDRNHEIIVGHTRFEAAKRLGFKTVPVVVEATLSDAQVKAYRIMDNRVGEYSEWDKDLLLQEVDQIQLEVPELSLEWMGFQVEEIDQPATKEEWDVSNVHDVFVITAKGPLDKQDSFMNCIKKFMKENEDVEVEISHIKQRA